MWGGIPDVTATENDPDYVHQGFWFDDAEDGAGALTYAVTGNTNPGLVTPTVVFDSMSHMQKIKLDYAPTGLGSADIAIRATDTHGLWVEDTFRVTVNAYVQTQTDPSGSPPYVQSYVAPYVPPPTETVLPPVITITPTIDVTPTAPSSLPGQMAVDALTPPMLSQPEQLVAAALPPAVVEMLQAAEAHLAEVQQAAALQAAAEAIKTAEIKAAEVKAGEAVPPPGAVPGEQVVTKDGMPVPKPMKEQGAGEAKVSMEGFAAAGKEGGPAKGPVGPIVVAGKPGVVPGQVPVAVVPQVVVFNMASVSTNDLFTSAKVEVGTTPMGKSGSLGTYLNDSAPPPPVSTVEKAALAQEKAENLMWDNVSKHIHGCTRCSELAGQAVQVFW